MNGDCCLSRQENNAGLIPGTVAANGNGRELVPEGWLLQEGAGQWLPFLRAAPAFCDSAKCSELRSRMT